jgi:hypothetical protein
MNLNESNNIYKLYIKSKQQPVMTVDERGKYWRVNGKLHREDGPAIEYATGDKYWYLNDKLHREDGPAVERINGSKSWHLNDKFHRKDGPAIECADGITYWYLNGRELTEEAFNEYLKAKQFNKELASKENSIFSQEFLDELIL